jgi:hypothetical protein
MNNNYYKRFYTPQFSEMASVTVRRLAWALGTHMTKAIELFIREIATFFPASEVCPKCKDKSKCNVCGFSNQAAPIVSEVPQIKTVKPKKSAIAA